MPRLIVAVCIALGLVGICSVARAETRSTFALVVTNNRSSRLSRPDLRYADDDGAKYYEMFRMLGQEGDVALLTTFDDDTKKLFPDLVAKAARPSRANLLATAKAFAERIRAAKARGPVDFYFVFAGHGDIDQGQGFLELEDGPLTSDDLQTLVRDIPATRSHVILDSCNAFFAIQPRKPGGRHFVTSDEAQRSLAEHLPETGVFLSTSAEGSVFEWSSIQSGIFSHAVRSGLAGGADADGDGHVTYDELQAFVIVATKDVKNPAYRPQVFARGPGGRGSTPLFDLTRATGKRLRTDAKQQRLTIRDAADVPWFEVHEEDGMAAALTVPARIGDGTAERALSSGERTRQSLQSAEGQEEVRLASLTVNESAGEARGAGDEIFRSLFARPFGPRAYAQIAEEQKAAPPTVFGVSPDERERMRLLLKESADGSKSGRLLRGAMFLPVGLGLTAVTVEAVAETAHEGLRVTPVGAVMTGLVMGGGLTLTTVSAVQLFRPSLAERTYARFTNSLALAPDTQQANLQYAEAERDLLEAAAGDHRFRTWSRWVGFVMAVNAGVMTGAIVATDGFGDRRMPAYVPLIGGGMTVIGGALFFNSLFPSATERMAELWKNDPSFGRARSTSSFSIAPTFGLTGAGFQGTF